MKRYVNHPSCLQRARDRHALLSLLAASVLASAFVASSCGGETWTGPTDPPPPPVTTPTITSVSPTSGANLGGTDITITGTNFAAGATVTVGGVAATNVRFNSTTSISAVTGPHAPGAADVVVSVNGQGATLAAAFTYVAVPANSRPVITALTVQGTRPNEPANFADVNEEVVLTATVTDVETPVNQLTYEWSADVGTITSATGATARWRAPAAITTVVTASITLKVTEVVATVAGVDGPSVITQSTIGTATASVHNSLKEIGDMSRQFLLDFSDSSLSAEYVVRDFWDGCPGKASELQEVKDNRTNYFIRSSKIGDPTNVSVGFKGVCAVPNYGNRSSDGCAIVQCEWHDTLKATGATGTTTGPDYLSAVFRSNRWWLCNSDFPQGTRTSPIWYPTFIK